MSFDSPSELLEDNVELDASAELTELFRGLRMKGRPWKRLLKLCVLEVWRWKGEKKSG